MMRNFPYLCMAVVLVLLGGLAPALYAQQEKYVLNGSLPYGAVFPPGMWVPLQMEFTNYSNSDMGGWGVWPVKSGHDSVDFQVPVTIPAHSRVRLWSYGFFPTEAPGGKEWSSTNLITPLTTLEWRDPSGARLSRVPVLGSASWASVNHGTGDTSHPGWVFLAINCTLPSLTPVESVPHTQAQARAQNVVENAQALQDTCSVIRQVINEPVIAANVSSPWAPRQDAGYTACRFVVLQEGNPDNLDAAQRDALLRFVRAGGNLIVASPQRRDHIEESWVAPYLPVRIIGHRLADQILPPSAKAVKLQGYVPIAEAVASPDAHVVLQDAHYVHVAWREFGRGRVIFLSFPVSAIDPKDPQAESVWGRTLNTQSPITQWRAKQLGDEQVSLVAGLLGKPTASWLAAAALAGGFVLLVVVAQLAFVGARRPHAFSLAVIVAVVLSVALVGWTMVRTGQQALMGAGLSVMDIGPDGGGQERDIAAYVGKNIDDFSIQADRGALIRPIVSSEGNPPVILEKPFRVPQAQVKALRVERVWQADGSAPENLKATASAQFGENGLNLTIDNATGQALTSPVWIWDRTIFSLGDLPPGQTHVIPDRRNGDDDYTNAAVIRSQSAQWRGQTVAALHTPSETQTLGRPRAIGPEIDAWLSQPKPLIQSPAPMNMQALARLPVTILPSKPGSTIKIDAAYMQMVTTGMGIAQYNPITGQWLPTNLDASLLIGFAAPAQAAGSAGLTPLQVNLDFDINAPEQTLTIRRGQVLNGKPQGNGVTGGPIVGQWTNPVERHQVTFTPEPSDYDAQGRIWLLVEVHSPVATGGNVVAQWHFRYIEAGMTAKVK